MQHARAARRSVLLALTLLSACAASEPSSDNATGPVASGVIGNYLTGRYALSEGDSQTAANDLLKALAQNPDNQELKLQAFIASLDAGRPEAVKLARQLPDSQVAQLVLADVDIKAGRWQEAEARFHALPRQGMTQLLQPLLVAWAQQGAGRTDTALSTLRPYVETPRYRALFALQAAMIADLAGVPISVGFQSGSHYSTIQALEQFMARSEINLTFEDGMLFHRMSQLIEGKSPAAALFNGPYYLAEQLGFRKVIDTSFMIAAMIKGTVEPEDVRRYFRALRAAQRDIDLRPSSTRITTRTNFPSSSTPSWTRGAGDRASGSCSRPIRRKCTSSRSTGLRNTKFLPRGAWERANTTDPPSRLPRSNR